MSLLILDNVALILEDLNKELDYHFTQEDPSQTKTDWVILESDGLNHKIKFLGKTLWDSKLERDLDYIPPRAEIELNERSKFEKHLRLMINSQIQLLSKVDLL